MIRREPDGTQHEIEFFIDIDLSTADVQGLKIGGFYDRHPLGRHLSGAALNDRPTGRIWEDSPVDSRMLHRQSAAKRIARWTHGATIVGAVPNFDTETLDPLLREAGLVPAWRHRLRCVESLTAGYLRREVGGLSDCAEALGIAHPNKHVALADTRTAMAIFDHIMGAEVRS